MPPLEGSNELGFWEPGTVVRAHEAFLANVGSSWDDVEPLPDGLFVSAPALELRRHLSLLLQDEYGTSPLFVVKDPRISRLLPLWFAVMAELQVAPAIAIAVRNPLEVAASLKARDGFTTTKSLLLWLRHALEAEQHSRGRPRSIVLYDELLRDWQGVLAKLGADLEIKWPSNSYRAPSRSRTSSPNSIVTTFSTGTTSRGEPMSSAGSRRPILPFAHRIQRPFSTRSATTSQGRRSLRPDLEEARRAARRSDEKLLEATAARDTLAAESDARGVALEARAAEVQQLHEEAAGLTKAVAASDERAAAHWDELDRVRKVRDAFASEVEVLASEVERLAGAVRAAQSRAEAAEPEIAVAREKLQDALTEVERLTAQANESASRVATLEAETTAERATLLTALEAARAEVEQLEQDAAAANAALSAVEAQAAAERAGLLEQLQARFHDAEESRAARDRLEAEVADAHEEQARLLISIEQLEASLESASVALSDHEGAFAARRTAFDAERSKLLTDLEAAHAEVETARSDLGRVGSELETLKSDAASERAALIAEREAARTEAGRLVAEIETGRAEIERVAAGTAELESALDTQGALLHSLRSVTKRRTPRRRSLSQLGSWLLPPTPRKLSYLRRYLFLGWSGEFDVDSYLAANPDVLAAGVNPLMHYVEHGRTEGRQPFAEAQQRRSLSSGELDPPALAIEEHSTLDEGAVGSSDVTVDLSDGEPELDTSSPTAILTDDLREALEADFDREYYRGVHDDIERSGIDPLEHYFYTGWREGRDPSTQFSTSYYLSSNPDVAADDLNPLVHYVLTGRREGRRPSSPTGFKRQTLAKLRPLDEEIAHWQHGLAPQTTPLGGASLAARLGTRIGTRRHVVLSCGHDNYTKIVGGVQLCVALEQAAFSERDCAYINLHPVQPLPVLSPETEPEALTLAVLCDGEEVGTANAAAVIDALAGVADEQGVDFGLVVHALHGHSPEVVAELHSRLAPRWAWLWLHDYFGICPSATLLRNRIEPCGAPQPESPGCTICVFGEERLRHLPRFHALLARVPFKLVAPSQFMADRWKLYFGREELDIAVHEIGTLSEAPPERGRPALLRLPPKARRALRFSARRQFTRAGTCSRSWSVEIPLAVTTASTTSATAGIAARTSSVAR